MSENEYAEHAAKMKAARDEFLRIYPKEAQRLQLPLLNSQLVAIEETAWRIFLHAKGLAK